MNYEDLELLFKTDPEKAIIESQKMIYQATKFDSYQDFYNYHLSNAHISTCQSEWSDDQLCVYCLDCSAVHPACVCLECFLNGNHKNHNYIILSTTGNCDCGDCDHWKPSGFCSKHKGLNVENPENYLDEKLRTLLTDVVFKAAFSGIFYYSKNECEKSFIIFEYLNSFLKFGDGFRRLISYSMTEKNDFNELMHHILEFKPEFNQALQQFCGGLINDVHFRTKFSMITYSVLSDVVFAATPTAITNSENKGATTVWDHFWFHVFSEECSKENIAKGWDWKKFFLNAFNWNKTILKYIGKRNYCYMPQSYIITMDYFVNSVKTAPPSEVQAFFDSLVDNYLFTGSIGAEKNDTLVTTSTIEITDDYNFFPVIHFIIFCYNFVYSFENKPYLNFDKLFDSCAKFFDISPIFAVGMNSVETSDDKNNQNDKFVSSFLPEEKNGQFPISNYKSFHNGASFFINCIPMHFIVSLFRNDVATRAKIGKILSSDEFMPLRIKLGIISLKTILFSLCYHLSLAPANNIGMKLILKCLDDPDTISKFTPRYIPFLQLIIGIKSEESKLKNDFCLKEFFAFEAAREIGLFDDFSAAEYKDENVELLNKQMIFSFMYLSLLIVLDRNLFNYNGINFIKEQIIFALKKGIRSIDMLYKNHDQFAIDSSGGYFGFNEALMDVAVSSNKKEDQNQDQSKSSNQEASFHLKEDVEWDSISGINSINGQMELMNKEITKSPDKLIKIPSFVPEEELFKDKNTNTNESTNVNLDGISMNLKQLLFTPTVLGIVYHELRTSSGIDSPNCELNDHLAMNILILIAKLLNETENETSEATFDDSTTIYYMTLNDLITKMKKTVFKYKEGSDGSATIENTLNSSSFINLLKMKISSANFGPKSFIEVLQMKGKLGNQTLKEMSAFVNLGFLDEEKSKLETNQRAANREKAQKLKASIMNQYKDLITNYNYNATQSRSIDSSDDLGSNPDKETCSICSIDKENEIVCYPLYVFRTKFPFIIDKPPLIDIETLSPKEKPADDNSLDYGLSNETSKEEEEEEEESQELTKVRAMEAIYNNFPFLLNSEGVSDEEFGERSLIIQMMMNSFFEQDKERKMLRKQGGLILKDLKETERESINKYNGNKKKRMCTAGANFVLQFGICQHPVHWNCVRKQLFNCPIDRSIKNCMLPCIDGIPNSLILDNCPKVVKCVQYDENQPLIPESPEEPLSSMIAKSIQYFLDRLKLFTKDKEFDVFIELTKSLSGLISTFEIRLRNLPDCLDSPKTKILARNLFLNAWFGYRINNKPEMKLAFSQTDIDVSIRLTLFQNFIKALIESDAIESDGKEEEFARIVSDFLKKGVEENMSEKEICLFLRRVCLVDYFLLDNDVSMEFGSNDIIDWDEVLSQQNLSQRYRFQFKCQNEAFEFKPFTLLNLPKDFLNFFRKPFLLPIDKTSKLSLFNMIDYNYLIEHYDAVSGEFDQSEEDEMEKNRRNLICYKDNSFIKTLSNCFSCRNYPSLFLFIGKQASKVLIVDQDFVSVCDPFYIDKFGCQDIGYKRSQPLFLNEEIYERLLDQIISGEFSCQLRPIDTVDLV